jgi:hypothetical protein
LVPVTLSPTRHSDLTLSRHASQHPLSGNHAEYDVQSIHGDVTSKALHSQFEVAFDSQLLASLYTTGYGQATTESHQVTVPTLHSRHHPAVSCSTAAQDGRLINRQHVMVCPTIDSVPPGRQPTSILKCGMCNSNKLFSRKYELDRHMATHAPGQYPCLQPGCLRKGEKAFKRTEHLRGHMTKVHGI